MNAETSSCQNCKQNFTLEPEDFEFYEKIRVPPPTFCPDCRMQRRLTWRNERTLFKRSCALCDKKLISVFSDDRPFPMYCSSCYYGDAWDPMAYGAEYDPSRPFLEQFRQLQLRVPRQYALSFNNVNSDYVNAAGFNKNSYLVFVSDYNEDSAYLHNSHYCKDTADAINSKECEFSRELVSCQKVVHSAYLTDCRDSYNLLLCKDCVGCHDCIGSVGLRKKQYCIFNEQYSKEEYEKKKKELGLDSYVGMNDLQNRFRNFVLQFPVKYLHGASNQDTTGDDISNSKDSQKCFASRDLEGCKFIVNGDKAKDCYDVWVAVGNSERCYESIGCLQGYNLVSVHLGWTITESAYLDACEGSSNLFGCVGLRQKQYCILNRQYSKEEYLSLIPGIVEQMTTLPYRDTMGRIYRYGDFFPAELSPYSYNQTVAQELFPLNHEQAIEKGFTWTTPKDSENAVTLRRDQLPEKITDVQDSILAEVIECAHQKDCAEQCTGGFRIIPLELDLCRKLNLPIPNLCPNCRHGKRLAERNPFALWQRTCACTGATSTNGTYTNLTSHPQHGAMACPNTFETSYAPDRPEIVYCETCYQAEVV